MKVKESEKTIRLLVVEDNDADAVLLKHALKAPGVSSRFEVERAGTLARACELISRDVFDVVLLDLSLPDSRGVETVRKLRATNPNVPIIVLSGLDDDMAAFESIKAEAQDYLVKGQAGGRQIEQAVNHAIERHNIQNTFREALIVSADAIVIFSDSGEVLFRNQNAQAALTEEDVEKLFQLEAQNGIMDAEFLLENGSVVEVRSVRLVWDRVPALFCGLRDITAKKRAAAQLQELQARALQSQRLESLGTLAGGVAHEFNNLLTGILGNSDLLAQGWVGADEIGEIARDIRDSAQRAARLTRHLLGFARRGNFRNEKFDLHQKIKETRELLEPVLRAGIQVEFDLKARDSKVECDPDQLAQVLLNLALNGQDAMEKGGTITFRTREDSFKRLVLEVCDQGTGIPEEIRERIFDPFFTTKPQNEGTGMGLAMVWGTANQNGWILDFETEEGKGTCFRISFPGQEEEPQGVALGRVALVDKENCVRALLKRFLRQLNYDVSEYVSHEELLESMNSDFGEEFDAILVDCTSSSLTPPELLIEIRKRKPNAIVMFMSGDANSALNVEADGFLFKPFDFKLVAHVLHQALSRHGHPSVRHLSSKL